MVNELKNFLVKDDQAYKLRIRVRDLLAPKEIRNIEFIGEQYDSDGKLIDTSTYQFFLNDEEIATLCDGLRP